MSSNFLKADSESAWNDLATLAYRSSKNIVLSDALLIGLEDSVIWSRIGSFYNEFSEDYNKAIEFYDRALLIKSNSPTVHLSKAQVYAFKLNDPVSAKASLSYVHSLKKHMWGWYKSQREKGIFNELQEYIASIDVAHPPD